MLEINNINVTFDKNIIKNLTFKTGKQLVLITGESGCGKTTLLNVIAGKLGGYDKYIVDGKDVDHKYFSKNIFYSKQEPVFENDLTMKENMNFLLEFYNINEDSDLKQELLNKLDLKHTLDLYPKVLSDGELKRFSFFMSILTKRPIIILDEPFASVDKKQKNIMIDLVTKYLSNRTTIIASHDKEIVKHATLIYAFEPDKITIEGSIVSGNIDIIKSNFQDVNKYYWKTLTHRKLYQIINQTLTTTTVCLIAFSVLLINLYYEYQQQNLSTMFSNQFLIYQRLQESDQNLYSGYEYPLSSEILAQLNSIPEISTIRPYYYLDNDYTSIKYKDKTILSENDLVQFITYDDSRYNSMYVDKSYNDSGIYISMELGEKINDISNGDEVTLTLPVPQYYTQATVYATEDDYNNDNPSYYAVAPVNYNLEINIPIAGVLKDQPISRMGVMISTGRYVVYVPQSIYDQYVAEYKTYESYEENGMEYIPYSPNAYIVEISNIKNVSNFKEKIDNLGLTCDNEYFDTQTYLETMSNTLEYQRNILLALAGSLTIIVLVIKFFKRKEDLEYYQYLLDKSNNKQYSLKSYLHCLLYRFAFTFLISLCLCYIIILILSSIYHQSYSLSLINILIILVYSFFIEFSAIVYIGIKR